MAVVRTVLGDIPAEELGVCYPHEHLLGQPPSPLSTPDLKLNDEAAAIQEMNWFRQAGGESLVEMSTPDYNRDVKGLVRISKETGVHIVCATGYNKDKFSSSIVKKHTVDQLTEQFIREVESGIDGTSIRAGVIKAASTLGEISDHAEKVFRAAARAHHETGAPISTHTEAGTMGLEQIKLLQSEGVGASCVIVGHVCRKLDWEYHRALAETGAYLGFDQLSKEKYAPDRQRIQFILRLVDEGFGQQLLLSGDLARRSYWPSYGTGGGPGFCYILWRIVPWLRTEGLTDDEINMLIVDNPSRALRLRQ